METATIYEIIGYVGSALVLVSFLMASVVKLRIVNSVGSLIFAVYALLIKSYPTMVMNICLVLINLYYLWKLRNSEPNYRLIPVRPDGSYVDAFLTLHREDIVRCFPGRNWNQAELNRAFLVCQGDTAAGLLLGTEQNGALDIALEHTTPAYRDSSEGRYLVENLRQEGISLLRYEHAEEGHVSYLTRLDFKQKDGVWERKL